MKIGRNDPCPCGSGIKYKKCCAGKQDAGGAPPGMDDVMGELRQALERETFGSLEEANAFIAGYMRQQSQSPIDDFHGLSSQQMHRLLNFPFDTPELVTFPALVDAPEASITVLFNLLAAAIGSDGLKATATGNLPRNFCREAAVAWLGDDGYRERIRYGGINTEPDFPELHVTRIVAETAGLVRKYKGKFILSKECRNILKKEGQAGIYPRLFRALVREYNWGYQDRYEELGIVQQSCLFTLYLLQRYGGEWRTADFYADNFLRAFPMAIREVPETSYATREETVSRCYRLRSLERFAQFAGLVEIERAPGDKFLMSHFRLRKLPLLDFVVKFHLGVTTRGTGGGDSLLPV